MNAEYQQPLSVDKKSVVSEVIEFTSSHYWSTPEFIEATKPYLDFEGVPDMRALNGINEGAKLAASRILQIQNSCTDMETRAKAASVQVGSVFWSDALLSWDADADPHGLGLLAEGIEIDKGERIEAARMAKTELEEQRHRTGAETLEIGHQLIVDFYRGQLEPQGD